MCLFALTLKNHRRQTRGRALARRNPPSYSMSSRTGALSELLVGLLDKPEDLHGDTALCMGDGRPRKRSRIDMVGTAEASVVAPWSFVQRERGGAASADVDAWKEPKQPRKAKTPTAMMVMDVSEGEDGELRRLDGLQPGYEQPRTDSGQASRPRKRKVVTDSAHLPSLAPEEEEGGH